MNNQNQTHNDTSPVQQRPQQHFSANKENDMAALLSQTTETKMKSTLDESPDINSAAIANDHMEHEDAEGGDIKRPTIKKRKYSKFGCKEYKICEYIPRKEVEPKSQTYELPLPPPPQVQTHQLANLLPYPSIAGSIQQQQQQQQHSMLLQHPQSAIQSTKPPSLSGSPYSTHLKKPSFTNSLPFDNDINKNIYKQTSLIPSLTNNNDSNNNNNMGMPIASNIKPNVDDAVNYITAPPAPSSHFPLHTGNNLYKESSISTNSPLPLDSMGNISLPIPPHQSLNYLNSTHLPIKPLSATGSSAFGPSPNVPSAAVVAIPTSSVSMSSTSSLTTSQLPIFRSRQLNQLPSINQPYTNNTIPLYKTTNKQNQMVTPTNNISPSSPMSTTSSSYSSSHHSQTQAPVLPAISLISSMNPSSSQLPQQLLRGIQQRNRLISNNRELGKRLTGDRDDTASQTTEEAEQHSLMNPLPLQHERDLEDQINEANQQLSDPILSASVLASSLNELLTSRIDEIRDILPEDEMLSPFYDLFDEITFPVQLAGDSAPANQITPIDFSDPNNLNVGTTPKSGAASLSGHLHHHHHHHHHSGILPSQKKRHRSESDDTKKENSISIKDILINDAPEIADKNHTSLKNMLSSSVSLASKISNIKTESNILLKKDKATEDDHKTSEDKDEKNIKEATFNLKDMKVPEFITKPFPLQSIQIAEEHKKYLKYFYDDYSKVILPFQPSAESNPAREIILSYAQNNEYLLSVVLACGALQSFRYTNDPKDESSYGAYLSTCLRLFSKKLSNEKNLEDNIEPMLLTVLLLTSYTASSMVQEWRPHLRGAKDLLTNYVPKYSNPSNLKGNIFVLAFCRCWYISIEVLAGLASPGGGTIQNDKEFDSILHSGFPEIKSILESINIGRSDGFNLLYGYSYECFDCLQELIKNIKKLQVRKQKLSVFEISELIALVEKASKFKIISYDGIIPDDHYLNPINKEKLSTELSNIENPISLPEDAIAKVTLISINKVKYISWYDISQQSYILSARLCIMSMFFELPEDHFLVQELVDKIIRLMIFLDGAEEIKSSKPMMIQWPMYLAGLNAISKYHRDKIEQFFRLLLKLGVVSANYVLKKFVKKWRKIDKRRDLQNRVTNHVNIELENEFRLKKLRKLEKSNLSTVVTSEETEGKNAGLPTSDNTNKSKADNSITNTVGQVTDSSINKTGDKSTNSTNKSDISISGAADSKSKDANKESASSTTSVRIDAADSGDTTKSSVNQVTDKEAAPENDSTNEDDDDDNEEDEEDEDLITY
ncbi:hypothetical protein B5S32_g4586 [[Candida] boidinii]|nr:hypothetical protein B5S32_g4586 [[Candida] boidinii]